MTAERGPKTDRNSAESLRVALRDAEAELKRLRDEVAAKENLVGILHDVVGTFAADDLFHMLARRLARALDLSHSSVIFADRGSVKGVVACAFEDPQLEDLEIELAKYPEVGAALEK